MFYFSVTVSRYCLMYVSIFYANRFYSSLDFVHEHLGTWVFKHCYTMFYSYTVIQHYTGGTPALPCTLALDVCPGRCQ